MDGRIAVAPSDIHGLGLRATAAVAKGELLIRWGGEIVPKSRLEGLKRLARYDCAAISEDEIILFALDDPVVRGNHSCDSNLWMADATSISARRTIGPGEELTIDYGLLSDDAAWTMQCVCGSAACRGVVTGWDWKRPDLQERYAGHFVPYLERRFRGPGRPY